jgi:cell division protein FtsB
MFKSSLTNRSSDGIIIFQAVHRMKQGLSRIAYALAFLLVATYAVATLAGPKGLGALFEKERQIQAAEKRNADLAKDIEREQRRIDRIAADQAEQERIVEERLNLVHPGDKVFLLPDSKKK